MKKFMKITAFILVVAMLGCFAACGGNTDSDAAAVKVINIALTDEDYAFGVDKNNAELQQQVNDFVKEIKSDGTLESIINKYYDNGEPTPVESAEEDPSKDQLIVATNAAFAPFEYMEGNKFCGIDMELMKIFADKIGKELVIKNVDFDAVCSTVDNGYADIAAAGLTVNNDRTMFVTFSEPYFKASQMIIAAADDTTFDNCKTMEDVETILKGMDDSKKFGVQTGTTGEFYVKGDEGFGFEGYNVSCTGYQNGALAVQDLINGNIDYVVIDEAPANKIVESFNAQ